MFANSAARERDPKSGDFRRLLPCIYSEVQHKGRCVMTTLFDRCRSQFGFLGMEGAQVVLVDNVFEYYTRQVSNGVKFNTLELPPVMPPFSPTFVEFCIGQNAFGFLVDTAERGEQLEFEETIEDAFIRANASPPSEYKWMFTALGIFEMGRIERHVMGTWTTYLDEHGSILHVPLYSVNSTSERVRANPEMFATAIKPIELALSFMNCRNTQLVKQSPLRRHARHFEKRWGFPIVDYHILEIDAAKKQYERATSPQGRFDVMPLHIRRGNFATYTENHPLFGKYTGTFWRPATFVGSDKNGIRDKDYEVISGDEA